MSAAKRGRPPKGGPPRELFTARLTPAAKERLLALSKVNSRAAYELLEDAFWEFYKGLPAEDRLAAEVIASAVKKGSG